MQCANTDATITRIFKYLTLNLTFCGLTGEPIIHWGRGLSGLIHKKPTLVYHRLSIRVPGCQKLHDA